MDAVNNYSLRNTESKFILVTPETFSAIERTNIVDNLGLRMEVRGAEGKLARLWSELVVRYGPTALDEVAVFPRGDHGVTMGRGPTMAALRELSEEALAR